MLKNASYIDRWTQTILIKNLLYSEILIHIAAVTLSLIFSAAGGKVYRDINLNFIPDKFTGKFSLLCVWPLDTFFVHDIICMDICLHSN